MIYVRRVLVVTTVILITVMVEASAAHPQPQKDKTGTASGAISGRVTIDGQPIRGVVVFLQASGGSMPAESPRITGKTDPNGHFELKGVPAGTYNVQAFAPALVASSNNPLSSRPGRVVNLSDDEIVDGVDLTLQPGGVITGRVTDVDGNPLILEYVRIFSLDDSNRRESIYLPYNYMFSTDDRGEYRIFGLPPGRYLASVGVDANAANTRLNMGSTYLQQTFYPDATDQAKATPIELGAGSEASGIDITVGKPTKGFTVRGKIVDASTGKPVAGLAYGYGAYEPQRNYLSSYSSTSLTSNARGEFSIEGLTPGQYAAFAAPPQDSDIYSELGNFTIADGDVSGVVIKVHQGTTVTGHVILEGADGLSNAPRLSDVRIAAFLQSPKVAPRGYQVRIATDGSFRVSGMPSGLINFSISPPAPKGLTFGRIERDGVAQTINLERDDTVRQMNALRVGEGEEISGVNIVLSYGTGSIRGQVQIDGGELPPNTAMFVMVRRMESNDQAGIRNPTPDLRGRFYIDGLPSGEYELGLMVNARPQNGKPGFARNVKQQVSVTNGVETQVTFRVDVTAKDR